MRTSSRTVAVVLFDEVELLDVAAVASVLSTAGRQWNFRPFKIVPVGASGSSVQTRSQIGLSAPVPFSACAAPELLVVPGGYGARRAAQNAEVLSYLKSAGPGATHLFAVGNGALALAAAGLLEDVDVAVPTDAAESLAEYSTSARADTAARFRISGRVSTAATAGAALEAALQLVATVLGKKQAEAVSRALGIPWVASDPGTVRIVETDS
ncbi:MAG TPA: DJ-1/PfpI family protein [Polyangiaceae bacterium]|nr:DJ-1/PfpI family protein [Polyangiaceae bacterium]